MTAPRVEVDGVEETARNMAKLADRYGQAVVEGAIAGGQLVRSEAIDSIQSVSPGETVTRTRTGGGAYEHVASAEGDAPNTDTGRLVQSIQVEVTGKTVDVGTSLDYGTYLEFGTKRMGPRPWLFPAFERVKDTVTELIKKGVDAVSRNHGDV